MAGLATCCDTSHLTGKPNAGGSVGRQGASYHCMRVETRLSFDGKNIKTRVIQIQMKRTLQEPVVSRTVYIVLLLYELIQIATLFREAKRHTRVRSTCHLVNSHPNTENEHSDQDSFAERPSSATRSQASRIQKIYMHADHTPVI